MPLQTGQHRAHHGAILREAARLADAGQLHLRLDATRFALDAAEDAYRHLEQGRTGGKVVVDVKIGDRPGFPGN